MKLFKIQQKAWIYGFWRRCYYTLRKKQRGLTHKGKLCVSSFSFLKVYPLLRIMGIGKININRLAGIFVSYFKRRNP